MRRPIKFSPVRSSVDHTRGEAEGHYRRLNRNVVSRNEENNREPLRNAEVDAVGNFDGAWHLSLRETRPEFIALLAETIDYLDAHKTDFMHQLGGARNFGGGIVDCELVDPLYNKTELCRVFDRGKGNTNKMDDKDDEWADEYLPEFESALSTRVEAES